MLSGQNPTAYPVPARVDVPSALQDRMIATMQVLHRSPRSSQEAHQTALPTDHPVTQHHRRAIGAVNQDTKPARLHQDKTQGSSKQGHIMNQIIYIVGAVVVILAILSFVGLR